MIKAGVIAVTEETVKKHIKAALAKVGCWYFMPPANGFGRAGIPDFVGCYRGVFFAIEAKKPTGKLSPHQERERSDINSNQGMYFLISDVASADNLVDLIPKIHPMT